MAAVAVSESPVQVMITGDYLKTAIAIAKNVQILQPQDDEETGPKLLEKNWGFNLIQPRILFVESPGKTSWTIRNMDYSSTMIYATKKNGEYTTLRYATLH